MSSFVPEILPRSAGEARPRIKALLDHWHSVRNGGAVQFSEFDLSEIAHVLPYVLVSDVERDPFGIRYRLTGTVVDEMTGMNITGHRLDEFRVGIYANAVGEIESAYEACVLTGQPQVGCYDWPADKACGRERRIWLGIVPLWRNGLVSQCVCVEEYELVMALEAPIDWRLPLEVAKRRS